MRSPDALRASCIVWTRLVPLIGSGPSLLSHVARLNYEALFELLILKKRVLSDVEIEHFSSRGKRLGHVRMARCDRLSRSQT